MNIVKAFINGVLYELADKASITKVNQNLAPIEELASSSSRSYSVDEHLILDDTYYIVTAAISSGDALVEGTNIRNAKAGAEITELSTAVTEMKTYSTEERAVGTWIDGSTVYEKSYYLASLANGTVVDSSITKDNAMLLSVDGSYRTTNSTTGINVVTSNPNDYCQLNAGLIYASSGSRYHVYLTVRYIKLT